MRLKFFSHLILMVLLNLLVKPLAIFGIDAEVQNVVGAQEYGIYFSLLNFTYLFNIFLDFGITNFNIKYIAHYPHLAKQYIGKIIPLRFLLLILYITLTLIIAAIFGYNEKQYEILMYLIFNQFLISVILFFRSYFSGLLLLKIDIILSVLDKFLLIFIMGYLLYFQDFIHINVLNFVQVQTITLILTCLIALIFILIKVGLPVLKWNYSFNILIIRKSLPYALLIVLMMFYNRLDSVMLERLTPKGSPETGIYAQAFRLLDAFFMFASLFSSLLFPIFASMLIKKQKINALLESASSVLFSGAITLVVICFLNSDFLMHLIYENELQSSSLVFQYLIISFIPLCVTLIFGTLLTANGNLPFLIKISFIGIVVNIILNWFLIPIFGAFGSAITSLITQSIVAIFYTIFTFSSFKIKLFGVKFFKYLGFVVLLCSSGYVLQFYFSNYLQISFLILISITYLLLTNMLQWRLILNLLKK
ncbi:MAG: oligosaccharide flippase family protein [Bacteroidota bacterium]